MFVFILIYLIHSNLYTLILIIQCYIYAIVDIENAIRTKYYHIGFLNLKINIPKIYGKNISKLLITYNCINMIYNYH